MSEASESFYNSIRDAQSVLVLDLGFLGDTIHLIPALHCIRNALPKAKLTVMAGDHIKDILKVAPWIDAIDGYPRFPTSPGFSWHLGFLKKLRAKKYDAVINLNGSDRSAILTFLSGAPARLGRVPPKQSKFWKHCFTHTVDEPFQGPLYQQRWACLKQVGFPGKRPRFSIEIPEATFSKAKELTGGEQGFIHISPFTTQDTKELPEQVLSVLINSLQIRKHKVIVSCAPNDRERSKLKRVLADVSMPPYRVFDGNLSLLELAAVISRSSMHLGGDSGALHVALMTGVPTVSWWRNYEGSDEWMPLGDEHRSLIGKETPEGLEDIQSQDIMTEIQSLLSAK